MNGCGPLRPALFMSCLMVAFCANSGAQQPSGSKTAPFNLELTVNRVLVPVVVRDAHGHSVRDLVKEDFKVFDDGRPHPVSGFMVETREPEQISTASNTASSQLSPATPSSSSQAPSLPKRIIVFLFDDMHLSVEDVAHAREAGVKVLAAALTGSDMAAVVSISGRVNTGLTRDRAMLQDALIKLRPQGLYRPDAMDCPSIDYYEADLIANKHDSVAIQDANRKFANCNPAVGRPQDVGGGSNLPTAENLVDAAARRALLLGQQDVQSTYASIAEYVRRMAPLPGQRTLILVSSGFLNIERESLNAESRVMDLAAKSNVIISALDARGLYTTEITASERGPALSGNSLQVNSEHHRSSMTLAENAMAELAEGTGGTYFHNSNDLTAGLRELTAVPECIYLLELSLDGVKPNGTYHRLKVEVDRKGVGLHARRGYFMPKPQKQKR